MARTSDKREKLLEAAKTLIHKQGFFRTTLADIAEESDVPLGNVYYYFKTKEEILETVLEQRWQKLQETLAACDQGDPKQNLMAFVRTINRGCSKIAEFGCIIGSLCQELDKTQLALRQSADRCLHANIDWACSQFQALGYKSAYQMGFDFIARIEGSMLLAHAMQEPRLIKRQLRGIGDWIQSL